MNNKSRVVMAVLVVLLLALTGYIVYDKAINKKGTTINNELIEKVMKDNPDYEFVDIGTYNSQDIDYKYAEDKYEYTTNCLDDSSIQVSVKNGKLIYKIEEQEYESKTFNNVKKASVSIEGSTCGVQKIIVLTTDGNLYSSIALYSIAQNGLPIDNFEDKNNKEIIDMIDKSFNQVKLTGFYVDNFKFTRYIAGDPILVAIDSDNNKTLIKCNNYCTRITDQGILDYARTIGWEMPTIINKDGSICIDECKSNGKLKYNNEILKIQSLFMFLEKSELKYYEYVIDRQGYLYKIELSGMVFDMDYNIYKESESLVKKVGYKKLNTEETAIILVYEDGSTKKITALNVFDYSGKIAE